MTSIRKVFASFLVAFIFYGGSASAVTFTPGSVPPADFPFRIASTFSGLCWDVPFGNFTVGVIIQQYPCHANNNQMWNLVQQFDHQNRDFFLIRSVGNPNFCVARDNNDLLVLSTCAPSQGASDYVEWRFEHHTVGSFTVNRITALRAAGCVDIPNGSVANNVQLQLYFCHGGPNQGWLLLPGL